VKEDEMDRSCSTFGEKRNAYMISVGKSGGKRPLGRGNCRCVGNIYMDFKLIVFSGGGWIDLAQDRN
jgi:hypothetical protein